MRLESNFFTFDGQSSQAYNLIQTPNIKGLYREVLVGNKLIRENEIEGRDEPYFFKTKRRPLTFTLTFSLLEGTFTRTQLKEIQEWLFKDDYKLLVLDGSPSVFYYVIITGEPEWFHNGLNQGFFSVTVRCNAPYGFTSLVTTPTASLTDNLGGTVLEYENTGSIDVRPNIFITKTGEDGSVLFENQNNGTKFEVDMINGESIEVDGKNKIVVNTTTSSPVSPDQYWLVFRNGINNINIVGNADIYFVYRAPLYNN